MLLACTNVFTPADLSFKISRFTARICSVHFKEDDFVKLDPKRVAFYHSFKLEIPIRLKPNTFPSRQSSNEIDFKRLFILFLKKYGLFFLRV